MKIKTLRAREILDSRGMPTVEVDVYLDDGSRGRGAAPCGASTGSHEAVELRDRHAARYGGKGVRKAVRNVTTVLAPLLEGLQATDQFTIDARMREADGTENKSHLGANAMVATSMACCDAAAAALRLEPWQYLARLSGCTPALPLPLVNIISGGLHAGRQLEFQDFLIVPIGAPSYGRALEMVFDVYHAVLRLLQSRGYGQLVADEGGFGPQLESNQEALEILSAAIADSGYASNQVRIALDVAATHIFRKGCYALSERGALDREGMLDFLTALSGKYSLLSIEDGLQEEDWAGWKMLTQRLGEKVQIVGDDFFVSSAPRVGEGIRQGCGNAVLIKLNQVGTVSEALETLKTAREGGFNTVVSARSGETEHTFLADFAVGTGAGQIKIGSLSRSERLAKYNRLLRIEEDLPQAFVGPRPFERFF